MTSLFRSLRASGVEEERSLTPVTLDNYLAQIADLISSGGWMNQFQGQTLGGKTEEIGSNFEGYVRQAYQQNGVVFACMLTRTLVFSEARFQFRRRTNGRPGALFGTDALASLERPWPNGTTGDLLTRMIQDVDLAGNAYAALRRGGRIRRLRPDWVTLVLGSMEDADITGEDIDAEVIGYLYHPGGRQRGREPEWLPPYRVAHWAPIPDPLAGYRGMSWLTPIVREIMGDQAATEHKLKFFENGATVNLAVSLDAESVSDPQKFEKWIEAFDKQLAGTTNAYKTLYLAAGATATPIGADMKQIDFKEVIGKGETRIAAASGVPPVIVGLSEGLEASTYSNYAQARRAFADRTMRPLWRSAAASLATIIDVPSGAELWYDERDIPFLQEDLKDEAEIQEINARSLSKLIDAGYDPDSAVAAIDANDLKLLKHTGLVSVQLHKPGTQTDGGNGKPPAALPAPAK